MGEGGWEIPEAFEGNWHLTRQAKLARRRWREYCSISREGYVQKMKVRRHSLYRNQEIITMTEAQSGIGRTERRMTQLWPGH